MALQIMLHVHLPEEGLICAQAAFSNSLGTKIGKDNTYIHIHKTIYFSKTETQMYKCKVQLVITYVRTKQIQLMAIVTLRSECPWSVL